MQLDIDIEHRRFTLEVPNDVVAGADAFFAKMDEDMAAGWQMSRRYVEHPDRLQRCQIAADRLLTSLHSGNESLTLMMAGYILSRLPDVSRVEIDTNGEMFNTRFVLASGQILAESDGDND